MKIFDTPPVPPKDKDIFKDVNTLVKKSYPEYENQHPLFKKFGTRTGGMCDTWIFKKGWESLPEVDKWKYVAYCALYWQKQYEYWLDKIEYENYLNYLLETAKTHPEFMETYNLLKEKENK